MHVQPTKRRLRGFSGLSARKNWNQLESPGNISCTWQLGPGEKFGAHHGPPFFHMIGCWLLVHPKKKSWTQKSAAARRQCVLIVSKLGRPVKLSGVCCLLRWWPIHNDHVTGPSGFAKRKTLDGGRTQLGSSSLLPENSRDFCSLSLCLATVWCVSFKGFRCVFVLAMSKLSLPLVICMISTIETTLENSGSEIHENHWDEMSLGHRVLWKYSMTLLASWGYGTVELSKWMWVQSSMWTCPPFFKILDLFKAFTDSTMVNHHEKTQFGWVFFSKHFKQIQNDNTLLNLKWNLRISPWNRRLLWKPPLSGSMLNFRGVDHGIIRKLNHQ